jgi:N-acetylmuramoyl-L-alanine amidase
MRKIEKLVIHCSDSPDPSAIRLKDIEAWHKDRGFTSVSGIHCGYHYVIPRDGTLEVGRPESEVGAHVQGFNSISLGICLVGRKLFSTEQMDTLFLLLSDLLLKYQLPVGAILGHYELNPHKTCPNMQMNDFREKFSRWRDKEVSNG